MKVTVLSTVRSKGPHLKFTDKLIHSFVIPISSPFLSREGLTLLTLENLSSLEECNWLASFYLVHYILSEVL